MKQKPRSSNCTIVIAATSVFAFGLFPVQQQARAEWGGVGGDYQPLPQVLTPSSTDTDGDGIPNAWEDANSLSKTNPADARSDFDMDGLTALQEYQLSLWAFGYGKPNGKWATITVPRPTGFTTANPSVTLIECASNGTILARVQGTLTGASSSTTYPYTYSPITGIWTRISAPDGFSSVTSLTPLDVNSSGQVVGYFNSGGTKGFVWTPGRTGGNTAVYYLNPGSSQVVAIPKRISDTGYITGNATSLSGRSIAVRPDGTEITFPGMWTNPLYHDVNDYGEFIGTAYNPITSRYETFLASEWAPAFLTGITSDEIGELIGLWNDVLPDIDPDSIVWEPDPSGNGGHSKGTAIDRNTQAVINVHAGDFASFYWESNYQNYGGVNYWCSYPGFSQTFGSVNDWGEFSGLYSGTMMCALFDANGSQSTTSYTTNSGIFFFDGDYHPSKISQSIYGISNDPHVLIGTPFAIWSGSVAVPLTNLTPTGAAILAARLADNGNVIFQRSTTAVSPLFILKPNQDADNDGMPDDWEKYYGFDPSNPADASGDPDQDGISNLTEFKYRTNPQLFQIPGTTQYIDLRPGIDTDGDGMPNTWEWKYGLNYNDAADAQSDTDNDGLANLQEFRLGTSPRSEDSDGDGMLDNWETTYGLDPTDNGSITPAKGPDADSDGDGVSNINEQLGKTNPNDANDYPVQVFELTKGTDSYSNQIKGTPDYYQGAKHWGPFWIPDGMSEDSLSEEATPATQVALLADVAFPLTPEPPAGVTWNFAQSNLTDGMSIMSTSRVNVVNEGAGVSSGVQATRVWLKAPAAAFERKFHFLRVKDISNHSYSAGTNTQTFVSAEPVTFTIAANATFSGFLDLMHVPQMVTNCDITSYDSLSPVAVRDNIPATGVDDLSITADPTDPGYQENFWIMAPAGGSTTADGHPWTIDNWTKFFVQPGSFTAWMTCQDAVPDPGTIELSAASPIIKWTSSATTSSDNTPAFKIGTAANKVDVSLPIRVKAMKKRTVKVGVYPVSQFALGTYSMPTKSELTIYLNQVFASQVNAWMDVTLNDYVRNIPFAANGHLAATEGVRDEEDIIVETIEAKPEAKDFDIIVIMIHGVDWGQVDTSTSPPSYLRSYGHTIKVGNRKSCIVSCGELRFGDTINYAIPDILRTTCHEIGHIMTDNQGHPDAAPGEQGDAPLKGTNSSQRLMCTRDNRAEDGRQLVKREWDACEAWLKEHPDKRIFESTGNTGNY